MPAYNVDSATAVSWQRNSILYKAEMDRRQVVKGAWPSIDLKVSLTYHIPTSDTGHIESAHRFFRSWIGKHVEVTICEPSASMALIMGLSQHELIAGAVLQQSDKEREGLMKAARVLSEIVHFDN